MESILNSNITLNERVGRVLVGMALISAVMLNTAIPVWFALLAVYPVISAIMAWDPIYAVVFKVRPWIESLQHNHKPSLAR
jgi:hypothetical protein